MMKLSYLYGKLMKKIQGTCVINSRIDKTSVVGDSCNVVNLDLDKYSYFGDNCQIVNAKTGAFCSISDHVFIGGAEHPIEWISSSPVFQNVRHSGPTKRFAKFDLPNSKQTIIGNDVWIGHGVTIKQGVVIGNGAVVGSNALVTKNVLPYAVVGGVPAKILKYRFSEKLINQLLKTPCWSLPEDELQKYVHLIKTPEIFVTQIIAANQRGVVSCRLSINYSYCLERRAA